MQAVYFDGHDGEILRHDEIPEELVEEAVTARGQMLEKLAMYSDVLMEKLLSEEEVDVDLIHEVTKEAVQHQDTAAVLMGSAYRNKGVQLLLDAIVDYLPSPLGREVTAMSCDDDDDEPEAPNGGEEGGRLRRPVGGGAPEAPKMKTGLVCWGGP